MRQSNMTRTAPRPAVTVRLDARRIAWGVALWAAAACVHAADSPSVHAADKPLSFNRDIRPILSDACFACHGPDAGKRKGDLRLDVEEGALGGQRDAVIVRGKPDESELIKRILSTDESEVMPPPETKKTLTAEQKATLRRWVEQGAQYQRHWAFEPIAKPPVPASPANALPIDSFLLERISQAKLPVQPEADRTTLIRRVSFALTGLPPTIKEVDAFLSDASPQAYERMVDYFLASPRFGEEMARHWLDVARYADTHGLHLDNERIMWAYRDWVVRAFNENLPFDQFTTWQIAGDLLPNPSLDQMVATGFNRCNVTTSEGGSIEAEFVYRYAVERTTAVAQAWLGLTAGCAVCHDHKYDPLTTKEFYSLYAFFHSAADPAMDGNISKTPPFLKLPRPELKAAADAAAQVELDARAALDQSAAQAAGWQVPAEGGKPSKKAIRDVLLDEAFPPGTTSRSSSRNAVEWVSDPTFAPASGRRVIRQAQASNYTDTIEFKLRPYTAPENGVLEAWLRVEPLSQPQSVSLGIVGGRSATWTKKDQGFVRDGVSDPPVAPGKWAKLTVKLSDLGLKPGDRIQGLTLNQNDGIAYWDQIAVVGDAEIAKDPLESLTAWRKAIGNAPPPDVPGELHEAIRAGADKPLEAAPLERLRRFYLAVVARPANEDLAAARDRWEQARAAHIIAEEAAPGSMVYRELDKPRESFVMLRGQYDKPGEKVEPGVPAALPQIAKSKPDARLTRLDLAKWLTSADQPLMGRVTVNRFWQQLFGVGLVKTSYDFGSQGEPPTHPELLDWLATDFRESGWDVKRLVKQMLMTQAFRRSAKLTPEVKAVDPANRLYARGPRFRLDAEQVRDNALFVSGLLNLQPGGRGVNTYQPPNIWEPVGYSDSNTRFYLQDHGPALYRRSLYVFLKRTAPPPFMSNFDAPNREQVCVMRERSNTPLQALQLMNDVQHFEAARALAERVLSEGGATVEQKIEFLFRTVVARKPQADERQLLAAALERQLKLYEANPASAQLAIQVGESTPKKAASPPETAAWTMIANLVLNLDETVNRN
ncbi:MAG: PSD1 and planctomycete cytochrome C domain-containing protein [Pirellulales bacterium]